MFKKIKTQFRTYTRDLIIENHKNITTHLDKLNELASIKKYSTPECKICLAQEVRIALQCGHLLCGKCHKNIMEHTDKSQFEILDVNSEYKVDDLEIIECPICRTVSTFSINIYF